MLKVVSGPNAGAEIGIEKGRSYTIGKDPNSSDIVFQDLSVSRVHARLTVSDDGILEIEDLGSKNGTVVSGIPIAEKQIITPQDLIAVGTTVFLIIDREAPQETIYSPAIPSFEAPSEEPIEELPAPEETPIIEEDWKQKPLPVKHLIFAASFAAVFFIVFLSFFSLFKSGGSEIVIKMPHERIQDAIAKFEDVQFSFNPASGKLFLVGHVLTPIDYQELAYRLDQLEIIQSTENNIVIDELVWKSTNDVLNENQAWRSVSIHSPRAGKFVVSGFLSTNAIASQLYDFLTVNFPYLDRLENHIAIEENLNAQLQGFIAESGLSGVVFQINNGEIIVAGRYPQNKGTKFENMLKEIRSIKGIARVKNFAVPVEVDTEGFDISQQFTVGGFSTHDGKGFSVVLNGKLYTIGDFVDGLKIISIAQNTILLEKEGLKYRIDYTR